MAQLAIFHPPAGNSVPIISPEFCAPHLIDLAIVRKVMTITNGNFVVQDIMRNTIFEVKATLLSIPDRRVLVDAAGNPILTLKQKLISAHDSWQAFRGDSTESSDLIFTAKRSSVFQLKTSFHVFLASNREDDVCDFKVKGSWLDRSCVVYAGSGVSYSTVVARMHKKHSVKSILLGKDKFMVTVYPNVDYAFIISLMVILDQIN